MTKFISRWKTDTDPLTDIAKLAYPHTVVDLQDEAVATLNTAEDAEALLDWYKDNYEHGNITQKLVRTAPARAKLRYAAMRRTYLERKAERQKAAQEAFERGELNKAADREARRAAKLASRHAQDLETWRRQKREAFEVLAPRLRAAVKVLAKIEKGDVLSLQSTDALGKALLEIRETANALRSLHFGITTSNHFQAHLATS